MACSSALVAKSRHPRASRRSGPRRVKGGASKNLKLAVEKWGTSGDLAYSVSRFTGGITAPSGYVLAVVERQADGSLKTVAQVSIPDPPAK